MQRRSVDVDLEEARGDGFVDQRFDRGDLLVRIDLHFLRVGLEVVALQEDRTLPLLANRRAENDGCVLARPLLGVPNLAARDFEDERSDAEASGGAARRAGSVVREHPDVDRWDRETRELTPAARLIERKDRRRKDPEGSGRLADRGAGRFFRVAPAEDRRPDETV